MLLLAPISGFGTNMQKCKAFNTIEDVQEFLASITSKWDTFSVCPELYDVTAGCNVKKMGEDFHRLYVYPYTLNSRSKADNARHRAKEIVVENVEISAFHYDSKEFDPREFTVNNSEEIINM